MTKLSVNINKLATLRNSRGGNNPDLIQAAKDIERFGADGITVHPRPDERHIRYADVYELKKVVTTEFNIEGNCTEQSFVELVLANKPTQVTLVPDALGQLTSNHGWNTNEHAAYLKGLNYTQNLLQRNTQWVISNQQFSLLLLQPIKLMNWAWV